MVWSSRTIDTMIDGKATVILVFGYLLRNPHYDLLYILLFDKHFSFRGYGGIR